MAFALSGGRCDESSGRGDAASSRGLVYELRLGAIVPVHELRPGLRPTVESLLRQTTPLDIVIVAVNGKLARNSRSILGLLPRDPRLEILKTRGGLPSALNDSLAAIEVEIIFRLDADDLASPERVERQLELFVSRPELAVVGSQMSRIDADSGKKGLLRYPTEDRELRQAIRQARGIAHPAVAYRRDAVLAAGGYREDLLVAQDYELWLRMQNLGCTFANHSDSLTTYRTSSASLTARYPAMRAVIAINAFAHHRWNVGCSPSANWSTTVCRSHVSPMRYGVDPNFRWLRAMGARLSLPNIARPGGRGRLELLARQEEANYRELCR